MNDDVPVQEQFPVVATTDRSAAARGVLKAGETFAVFDLRGDLIPTDAGEEGLYHDGTRFLSRWELFLYRVRPLFLSSTITEDNALFLADLTNADIADGERIVAAHGEVHIARSRVLSDGCCCDRFRITNYARHALVAPLTFRFDSDFADLFEVRGTRRANRGHRLANAYTPTGLTLRYRGLDGVDRNSEITFSHAPDVLENGVATFVLRLDPHTTRDVDVSISCQPKTQRRRTCGFDAALSRTRAQLHDRTLNACTIDSSHPALVRWIRRSTADLHMMLTDTEFGLYPFAGIPWFSTPFGRDGIITAFELLWADPASARGVLAFLAATQATAYEDASDAQPGKIIHELRSGEMAALREVPFGRYYGTADATPLFVALAHAYYERTADRAFIDALWPHILAALDWIRTDGDIDDDGFVEYARRSATGLIQQGWKDSYDSVFHADGTLADPPIALCEVQGYAYAAWAGASQLAAIRGDTRQADEWRAQAERLRTNFEAAFWCEDIGTYALALDGGKRQCRVRTSNPGHCLFTGIVEPARAKRVAAALLHDDSFSGWGVRTLARGEARYNPMSYHNGSIWPHDNALAAAGLARYGLMSAATRILESMLDLSAAVDLHRLPELICGFDRNGGEYPTLYPVACAPQTWAAGALYLLLQSCLGLRIDPVAQRVSFARGMLPQSIDWLRLTKLRVGDASVDLLLERHPHDVGVTVLSRHGAIEVMAVK
jgi:glycogen debranching enzyme